MKGTHLLILLVAVVLAAGTAVHLTLQKPEDIRINQTVLGDFADKLPSLTRIEVSSATGTVMDARIDDGNWWAVNLGEDAVLPLDTALLSSLVDSLRTAQLIEGKTRKAENYSRLGVQDIDINGSSSLQLTLYASDTSFSIIVGNVASSGQGSYVRLPGSAQSWLASEVLSLPSSKTEWLTNPLSLMSLNDVYQITREGEGEWLIARDESSLSQSDTNQNLSPLILRDMADGESLKFATVIDSTLTAMLSNRFDSVEPYHSQYDTLQALAKITFVGADDTLSAELFETADGFSVRYQSERKTWVNDWLFSLSSFSFNQLNKTRQDFLAQAEEMGDVQ